MTNDREESIGQDQACKFNLIGLDTCLAVMDVFCREFNDPKYRPVPLLKEMVDAGLLGRKSGRGFHDYA